MTGGTATPAVTVVALLPAHDEEASLPSALAALRQQTRRPDHIIVIADNCTDGTAEVARAHRVEVYETVGNVHKKAGGLNQVLDLLLPGLADDDVILVQDADSFLDPGFIQAGLKAYAGNVGGVGGVFRGRIDSGSRWGRFVEWLQANEYARYELDIRRQRGKVLVLTGTATLLRVGVLREVVRARGDGRLPGEPRVYDTRVLTEDNELSFALMKLGYILRSPSGCTLTTETMQSWRSLAKQRVRWKRGALENLFDYGWTRTTRPYWGRQALGAVGVLVTAAYLFSLAYGFAHGLQLHGFWLGVTVLFMAERVVTVRRRGKLAMAVAATLVVEMLYDMFLQGVQATAYLHAATGRERRW
ncbi:glycosyltransferase family 2 protein [Kribbella sp.]|uniref:glycosyltransferase family 2 protein n=1 Tax=Kribbella sp. TaxID=1871183 RepID=UPI002D27E8ED|nr:glycosyltransferase family 2 protein [Kribbella sp.]HZX02654.1 glycosyltransferase family 2 protein [Kribbella sp.]